MVVKARRNDESDEVAFLRALVVCRRSVDKGIGNSCRSDIHTSQRKSSWSPDGAAWLRVGVDAVIGRVVVAIIVLLFLAKPTVVPPLRFVQRSAAAMMLVRMVRVLPMEEGLEIPART